MADVPSATQPASVSTTLRALLEKNGVDESVIAFLGESGCKELSSFSNWVEQKAELKQAVIDKTPKKDDPGELAKLKQAWREAEALNSRSLKRAAEGLQGKSSTLLSTPTCRSRWRTTSARPTAGQGSLAGRSHATPSWDA